MVGDPDNRDAICFKQVKRYRLQVVDMPKEQIPLRAMDLPVPELSELERLHLPYHVYFGVERSKALDFVRQTLPAGWRCAVFNADNFVPKTSVRVGYLRYAQGTPIAILVAIPLEAQDA